MTRPEEIRFEGRILYITEDPELLRSQLDGQDLDYDPERPLRNNISTDEITPGWVCFYYDETLGRYSMVGLKGGKVEKDDLKNGGFSVIVSGLSKGCGSSRETAPFSEMAAGVQLVIAESIEKIYGQNCQNIGLLTSTDFGLRVKKAFVDCFSGGRRKPTMARSASPLSWAMISGMLRPFRSSTLASASRRAAFRVF